MYADILQKLKAQVQERGWGTYTLQLFLSEAPRAPENSPLLIGFP